MLMELAAGHSPLYYMLGPGCLQKLRTVTLYQLHDCWGLDPVYIPPVSEVEMGLLNLPEFRILRSSELLAGTLMGRTSKSVESIVDLHRDRWECLYSKRQNRVYKRV